MQAHEALSHVFQCLQKSTPFENCQSHFDEPEPFIQWIDKETTTTVKIFKNCQNSVYTSRLIWLYLKMYPQLRELSIVFRTWASVCGLDQQKQGSIPSHALVLMCIFYMQRRKLIPILTEVLGSISLKAILGNLKKSSMYESNDEMINLSKISSGENIKIMPPISTSEMKYGDNDIDWSDSEEALPAISSLSFCCSSKSYKSSFNLATLWLDLLKFYAFEFPVTDLIIDIKTINNISRTEDNFSNDSIVIKDPFIIDRNICSNVYKEKFTFFMNRLKMALVYFHGGTQKQFSLILESQISNEYLQKNNEEQTDHQNLSKIKPHKYTNIKSKSSIKFSDLKFSPKLFLANNLEENEIFGGKPLNDKTEIPDVGSIILSDLDSVDEDHQTTKSFKDPSSSSNLPTSNKTATHDVSSSNLSTDDEEMQKESIFPTVFKASLDKGYQFTCRICRLALKDKKVSFKHIATHEHKRQINLYLDAQIQFSLPNVSQLQLNQLSVVLEHSVCVSPRVMKKVHLQNRLKLVGKLTNAINKDKNLYKLDLFGSSLYSCGFVGSDLNLNLKFPSNMQAHEALSHVFQCLQKSTPFENCQSHFDEPEPFIQWIDKETTTTVKIFKNCQNSVYTSRLIWLYLKMYPQLRELSIVFRTWASVCGLDQQKQGSIPSHALVLMCIFYMQRRKLIPILTEVLGSISLKAILGNLKKSSMYESNDEMINLSKISSGENIKIMPPISTSEMKYGDNDIDWSDSEEALPAISSLSFCCSSKSYKSSFNLATLWLDLLKFYAFEFPVTDLVIDIRTTNRVTRSSILWSRKNRLAILDPFYSNKSVCNNLSHHLFTYFMDSLKFAMFYFHGGDPQNYLTNLNLSDPYRDKSMLQLVTQLDDLKKKPNKFDELKPHKYTNINLKSSIKFSDLKFDREILTRGSLPPIYCTLCIKDGHLRSNCPQASIGRQPVGNRVLYPTMDRLVNDFCFGIVQQYSLSPLDIKVRDEVCFGITEYLRVRLNPRIVVSLFGSSRNGFGFRKSDMDMCLTIKGNKTGRNLSTLPFIKSIFECLRDNRSLCNVYAITTAKVPIVKFKHRNTGLEGDISLYNTLALCNTNLIKCYSMIDSRCKALGYALKILVKNCGIGDASQGSLSSYAYTLMVIFFLQQKEVPVLPVLQEIGRKPGFKEIKDGWDVYYFKDLNNLNKYWQPQNTQSISQLLIEMLQFYVCHFNYSKNVICIRQKSPLTVFIKVCSPPTTCPTLSSCTMSRNGLKNRSTSRILSS